MRDEKGHVCQFIEVNEERVKPVFSKTVCLHWSQAVIAEVKLAVREPQGNKPPLATPARSR